jgi:hypothetical protein
MRTAFVSAAAALLIVGSAWGTSAARNTTPLLTARTGVLHGSHFHARELVRVTFEMSGDSVVRRVRASVTGAFAITLPPSSRCAGSVFVVAHGTRGDAARLMIHRRPCDALP